MEDFMDRYEFQIFDVPFVLPRVDGKNYYVNGEDSRQMLAPDFSKEERPTQEKLMKLPNVTIEPRPKTYFFKVEEVVPALKKLFTDEKIGARAREVANEFNINVFAKVDKGTTVLSDLEMKHDRHFTFDDKIFTVYKCNAFGANKFFFSPAEIAAIIDDRFEDLHEDYNDVSNLAFEKCGFLLAKNHTNSKSPFCRLDSLKDLLYAVISNRRIKTKQTYKAAAFLDWLSAEVFPKYVAPAEKKPPIVVKQPSPKACVSILAKAFGLEEKQIADAIIEVHKAKVAREQEKIQTLLTGD